MTENTMNAANELTGELHHIRSLLATLDMLVQSAEDKAPQLDELGQAVYTLTDARRHVDAALMTAGAL